MLKHRLSQKPKIVGLLPVLLQDLLTKGICLIGRKCLGNLREMFAQPGPEFGLRPADDRPDFPKRIVEIECYGANSVQSKVPEK
jgi:hypothetical protein